MKEKIIKYRNACDQDIAQIEKLLESVNGDSNELLHSRILVAYKDKSIIGCIRIKVLSSKCKELSSLAVLPKYRNQGIASQLIRRIIKKNKYRPLYLLCSKGLQALYTRNNFQRIKIKYLPSPMRKEYRRVRSELTKNIKIVSMVLN